jgi:hypothetical protein
MDTNILNSTGTRAADSGGGYPDGGVMMSYSLGLAHGQPVVYTSAASAPTDSRYYYPPNGAPMQPYMPPDGGPWRTGGEKDPSPQSYAGMLHQQYPAMQMGYPPGYPMPGPMSMSGMPFPPPVGSYMPWMSGGEYYMGPQPGLGRNSDPHVASGMEQGDPMHMRVPHWMAMQGVGGMPSMYPNYTNHYMNAPLMPYPRAALDDMEAHASSYQRHGSANGHSAGASSRAPDLLGGFSSLINAAEISTASQPKPPTSTQQAQRLASAQVHAFANSISGIKRIRPPTAARHALPELDCDSAPPVKMRVKLRLEGKLLTHKDVAAVAEESAGDGVPEGGPPALDEEPAELEALVSSSVSAVTVTSRTARVVPDDAATPRTYASLGTAISDNVFKRRTAGRFGAKSWVPGRSKYTPIYHNDHAWAVAMKRTKVRYKYLEEAEAFYESYCSKFGISLADKVRPLFDGKVHEQVLQRLFEARLQVARLVKGNHTTEADLDGIKLPKSVFNEARVIALEYPSDDWM